MKKSKPHWVVASDDSFNKVLKFVIISLYCYAMYLVIVELIT